MQKIDRFPNEIHAELGFYVYKLIDPRNGETFYVGKGKGNRVFEHVKGVLSEAHPTDIISLKNERIRAIYKVTDDLNNSLEPLHVIHRHGMDEKTAFEVEAALIDSIGSLTNAVKGHGSSNFGPASALELINAYGAKPMEINSQDKLLLININKTFEDDISTYNAVRFAWKINRERAERAHYVLAIHKGVCRGVFSPDQWLPADDIEFIHFTRESDEQLKGRYGFKGCVADDDIMQRYKNKKLPDKLLWKRGAATPFKYTYE